MKLDINSKRYWNNRFKSNWEEEDGPNQSRFFNNIALENFPSWFNNRVKQKKLSICDWGCAFGDGTVLLEKVFPDSEITGIDFSPEAIKQAKKKESRVDFISTDLLSESLNKKFDILFSSNTLEHFPNPWEVFDKLLKYSKRYFVLLVPFREINLMSEHLTSFTFPTIQLFRGDWVIVHSQVIDASELEGSQWGGEQLLLIFSNKTELKKLKLSLSDVTIHSEHNNPSPSKLKEYLDDISQLADQKIAKLEKIFQDEILGLNEKLLNTQKELLQAKEDKKLLEIDVRNKTEIIKQREEIIGEKNLELERWIQENQLLYENLQKTVNSKRWKFINKTVTIINKVFPESTMRRKIVKGFYNLFKTVYKNLAEIRKKFLSYKVILKDSRMLKKTDLFDADYYKSQLGSRLKFFQSPERHYRKYGCYTDIEPSKKFDKKMYEILFPAFDPSKEIHLLSYISNEDPKKESIPYFCEYINNYFDSDKETVAFQVNTFDKGGLEEVVLSLATNEKFKEKYNIVIFVTTGDEGYLVNVAREQGVFVFGLYNNIDLLRYLINRLKVTICHFHYSLFGVEIYKSNLVKTLYTIHNNYIWADKDFVKERIEKYKFIDTFVAVSTQVKDFFSRRFNVDKSKIEVIPNGVDFKLLDQYKKISRSDYDLKEDDFVMINVASFGPVKCQLLSVFAMNEIVKKYPKIKLLFVGNIMEDRYYTTLKETIKRLGLEENVKVLDFMPKKNVMGLLKVCDCFLLPSLTEGFSISTIEAMYQELPLILTDVGGAREVIKDQDIGTIIDLPYEDIIEIDSNFIWDKYSDDKNWTNLEGLVLTIEDHYLNRKEWSRKGKKGKQKVMEIFNIERMADDYLKLIEIVKEKPEVTSIVPIKTEKTNEEIPIDYVFPSKPLVSIMLPVYNHSEFVIQAIESIRSQTYHNWELIILDDGSSDDLLEKLKIYSADSRIEVYTQKNQKLPLALTHLHQLAHGDLLTWTSADNILKPDMLMQLVTFLLINPESIMCYADVMLIDQDGNLLYEGNYRNHQRDLVRPYIVRLPRNADSLSFEADNFINACFLYRREPSQALGGQYAKDLVGLEDYDYWLRMSKAGPISHIKNENSLYEYRVHSKTMSEELLTKKAKEHNERILKLMEFEERRKQFAESGFNIEVSSEVSIKGINSENIGSDRTLYLTANSKDKKKEKYFNVLCKNNCYEVDLPQNRKIKLSIGYDIDKRALKSRYINFGRRDYQGYKGQRIIGIHFDLEYIDGKALSTIIKTHQNYFFVLLGKKGNKNKTLKDLFKNLSNVVIMESRILGEPYEYYKGFDALMIPPIRNSKEINLDEQKVLSWSICKPLLYPKNLKGFTALPLSIGYSNDVILPFYEVNVQNKIEDTLDKYIESYSIQNRFAYLKRLITTALQDFEVRRPDFKGEKITESLPKKVNYSTELGTQNFQSEIDYWDKELSLKGFYPEEIIKRTTPKLMKQTYPKILDKYRKQLKGKIKVLDVGSGPLSMLAYGHNKKYFELECVDPLGDIYKALLKKYNYEIPYSLITCPGEKLSSQLEEESYDIVWVHNALDHAENPLKVMEEMAKLLKKGGYLIVMTWENEGTAEGFKGLHKNDLYLDNGDLYWKTQYTNGKRIDNIENLALAERGKDNRGRQWITMVYHKEI